MAKYFNTSGTCYPDKHYMVHLDNRLAEIRQMVARGDYFVINRARQYGKTTTLRALEQYLRDDYAVLFLSFQRLSSAKFENEYRFSTAFAEMFLRAARNKQKKILGLDARALENLEAAAAGKLDLTDLFNWLSELCAASSRPVVLMIDEVDSASNNQVFLDFLAQLRDLYLDRDASPTFQSVILAGVYDIKNLKQKIRNDEEHRYNSPWNIAVPFSVDMSFSVPDITGLLQDYETDHHTGMDISSIADLIFAYTSGYPFLVSCVCKMLDEQISLPEHLGNLSKAWSREGILEAVKCLLKDTNTLFDDMRKKIADYPELRNILFAILFNGQIIPYNPDNYAIDIGVMFGFMKEENGTAVVANRIFETRIYNLFLSEELLDNGTYQAGLRERNQFIINGRLNMDLVLEKFVEHFRDIYGQSDTRFIEENGRRLFLLYLRPIINGGGNYYVEARTRDLRRTDVIVDYHGEQFIIEMKIWHGEEYNRRGEAQLVDYLDAYHLTKGYLLIFNFNKKKTTGLRTILLDGKTLVEAVV